MDSALFCEQLTNDMDTTTGSFLLFQRRRMGPATRGLLKVGSCWTCAHLRDRRRPDIIFPAKPKANRIQQASYGSHSVYLA